MTKWIKMLSADEIARLEPLANQPAFRIRQLMEWLFVRRAQSYDEMTNLPADLRHSLAEIAPLSSLTIENRRVSADGTRKYLFRLADSLLVETVGIPALDDDGRLTRLTVCFSTQVGCPMGCIFCATGYEGFTRNLGMGEIVDQVLAVQEDFGLRVSNLVAMGQGEPFANYQQVLDSLRVLNNPKGIAIGARKITVSTCGIVSGIEKFALEPEQFTLAISLHSARQEVRNRIMPGVAGYPLTLLRTALFHYVAQTNRRVTLEYLMMAGINDSQSDLDALIGFCDGLLCHINLIPMNSISRGTCSDGQSASFADGSSLSPSDPRTIQYWIAECRKAGIEATIRHSKGADIQGACGQLKNARLSD